MKNLLFKVYNYEFYIDLSVHSCSNIMFNDIEPVFKNSFKNHIKDKNDANNNLKIICTWQKAKMPINIISNEVSLEMDRLYNNFFNFIKIIKKKIEEKGFWLDASDPHTGKCLFGEKTNFIYNELEGLKYLLKYESQKLGCCGMILHPEYQYHSYPITFFTNANTEMLKDILSV